MTTSRCLIVTGILVASANSQVSQPNNMTSQLHKSHPEVLWNARSAVVADVTCDGKPDTIALGSQKGEVIVGVVSGADPEKVQLFAFPVRRDKQDGFCAVPKRIEISPLKCARETEEDRLPGCRPIEGCKEFAVNDTLCDPFNFYWDSSRKSLTWWRE